MKKIRVSYEWMTSDGNAFAILGKCKQAFRKAGKNELWDEFHQKATSGDYDNLLSTMIEYFDLFDDDEEE